MHYKIFLLTTLGLWNFAFSQHLFSANNFVNQTWVSANYNRAFFKKDTIEFIRPGLNTSEYNEKKPDISEYFNSDFVEIEFLSAGKMKLKEINIEAGSSTEKVGTYKWRFNKKKQKFSIFFNDELLFAFCLYDKTNVRINSSHTYIQYTNALKFTAIKCK